MESAISQLTNLPTTRTQIADYVDLVKSDILSGYVKPEVAAIMLKSFEEIVKSLRADKDIKEHIQDACDLHAEKSFEFGDTKFSKSERPTYNFKECGSSRWLEASQALMKAKSDLKAVEDWLKTLKEETPDTLSGEMVQPPTVLKTSVVSIQLKK